VGAEVLVRVSGSGPSQPWFVISIANRGRVASPLVVASASPLSATSDSDDSVRAVRLIVARCEVEYTGRLSTRLAESTRLLMIKADGTVMIWSDSGGASVKPLNWMTPPTIVEEEGDPLERVVVRKRAGKTEDRLEIRIAEVLSDVAHEMGEAAGLEKDGVERDLQEQLAAQPQALGEELRLVRREWPTDIGPVDLMCRDPDGEWVAVEIKRIATIDAVEQLARYLERIRLDPARATCRGVLAAQRFKPQALTLAAARGVRCAEVDLELLRGEREPELTLFG
jgi:RecB family endonuclease NucS